MVSLGEISISFVVVTRVSRITDHTPYRTCVD